MIEQTALSHSLRNASECSPSCIPSKQPTDLLSVRLPIDFSKPIKVDLTISCADAFVYWVEHDGEVPGACVKGQEGDSFDYLITSVLQSRMWAWSTNSGLSFWKPSNPLTQFYTYPTRTGSYWWGSQPRGQGGWKVELLTVHPHESLL